MRFTAKQIGVAKGMIAAAIVAIGGISIVLLSSSATTLDSAEQLRITFTSVTFALIPLVLSIGLLARHRFFSIDDIDGSAMTKGTNTAHQLQAVLQNTLEQTVLAIGVYCAWAALMPAAMITAIPVATILFVAGRIAFAKGYAHGAPARAFGFALTFYPTVIMLFTLIVFVVYRWFN